MCLLDLLRVIQTSKTHSATDSVLALITVFLLLIMNCISLKEFEGKSLVSKIALSSLMRMSLSL